MLCLFHVKYFLENKYFLEMLFSGKENVFRLFGCLGIPFTENAFRFMENAFRFTKNQFPCLVRSNILQKMEFVFYGKSIPMFGLWIILRKI